MIDIRRTYIENLSICRCLGPHQTHFVSSLWARWCSSHSKQWRHQLLNETVCHVEFSLNGFAYLIEFYFLNLELKSISTGKSVYCHWFLFLFCLTKIFYVQRWVVAVASKQFHLFDHDVAQSRDWNSIFAFASHSSIFRWNVDGARKTYFSIQKTSILVQQPSFTWSEYDNSIRYLTWADRWIRRHWNYISVSTTTIRYYLWKINNKTHRHRRIGSQGDTRELETRD